MDAASIPSTAEVVIIGGGVMGVSTAYHLARAGCSGVLLLEKASFLGAGSTGANAGGIRHQFSSRVNIELSLLSFQLLRNFELEPGWPLDLHFCGYLFLFDRQDHLDRARDDVALQNGLGVASRLLSPEEAQALAPSVSLEGILGASFYAGDGLTDPAAVVAGYASGARDKGVLIACEQPVTTIRRQAGAHFRVETPTARIETPRVVLAAGPWSGEVGRLVDLDIPVVPLRRQIAVTRPLAAISRDFPFVIDFSQSLYFHYESGGILTGMSNPDETPGFHPGIDDAWRQKHFERAVKRLPLLADAELQAEWAGYYEVTPDSQPILGRLPGHDGLYSCTGFSGHGFMHGPAAGFLMAEEILEGKAHTIDIGPLRWRLFGDRDPAAEDLVV